MSNTKAFFDVQYAPVGTSNRKFFSSGVYIRGWRGNFGYTSLALLPLNALPLCPVHLNSIIGVLLIAIGTKC